MSLWSRIQDWFARNGQLVTVEFLPAGEGSDFEIRSERDYLRVWLSDMLLARDRAWFTDRHPTVHASVRLTFANRAGREFTTVARPPEGALGPGRRRDYALTPLIPYAGGVVELEAGLTAIEGESGLTAGLDLLQQLSGLLVPPLEQALKIADVVAGGVDKLLDATKSEVLLGTHLGFRSASDGQQPERTVLRRGHLACVNAPTAALAGKLTVQEGELHVAGRRLEGHDYMLFELEGRRDRDDWRFADLEALKNQAIGALLGGRREHYNAFRSALFATVLQSPDLTVDDRTRVVLALKAELDGYAAAGLGARGAEPPKLDEIIAARAMPIEEAALTPLPTLGQLLHDGM